MSFPKKFDSSREKELYKQSVKAGYFKPEYRPDAESFVIPVPPPNVTGVLHIGHGLFVTIQDAFARFRRMKGKAVLRAPGTDHAGISTQVQVEKKLKKENNQTRHELGRVDFLKKVRDFAGEHRGHILNAFKSLGASMDRDREQFTLSEGMSRAVRKSFKNLHDQGKIYLGYRIANRCTRCQTVLSDAEVDMKPTK
jgi:valyl-tRNA synthetase